MPQQQSSLHPLKYLREVKQELDNVTWPNFNKTMELTTLVALVSAIIAAYIGGLDYIFNEALAWLITL